MDTRPTVDYRATSARPAWADLPEAVQHEVGRIAGSAVVSAAPAVTSGFTGSYAGEVTCADGRGVFVKAGGPDMPHVVSALAQEAHVLAHLPRGIPAPTLVGATGAAGCDGWNVLLLEVIDGRMPGQPWTPADVASAHRACRTLAELTTPVPAGLETPSVALEMARDVAVLATVQALDAGTFVVTPAMPAGLRSWAGRLARLARGVMEDTDLLAGETLTHGDLRPDNLLVDRHGTTWVVDWNWVGVGPAWVDLVGLLPMMAAHGIDTAEILTTSPLTRGADPAAVDGYLAVIACYMLTGLDAPPPPGCTPALRAHQGLMARLFVDLVARHRRWSA